ncbi:MAG TPA: hypothetical protein ENL27_00045 [Candidatus Parcubacteria bacterium]|nr:hypothetical protein [Candidatus Parcubacteria bacterium]
MKKCQTIIDINEICDIYREYCEKENEEFSESKFQKFLEFLEIDFYDWAKENLRQFNLQK